MIKLQINPIDFRAEALFTKHKDEMPKMDDMVDRVGILKFGMTQCPLILAMVSEKSVTSCWLHVKNT